MTFNIEKVKEAINNLSESEQVALWNERCEYENYMDDYIYDNDTDELMYGQTPSDILSGVDMENYSIHDSWAYGGSIYGWRSFNYLEDDNSPFDIDEIIDWYCDNEGYEQTDYLDYEELIEDEEEDEEEQQERLEGCPKRVALLYCPTKIFQSVEGSCRGFYMCYFGGF